MADWRGVQQGLTSGYQLGRATGGKLSGLGIAIKGVADKMKQDREQSEEFQQSILGLTAKGQIESAFSPKEWKPKTKEEALSFEREKAGIKTSSSQDIIDPVTLEVVGQKSKGSVFKPVSQEEQLSLFEKKANVQTQVQEERGMQKQIKDMDLAVDSVKNLMVPMLKSFRSMRDVTKSRTGFGAGRVAGVLNKFGGMTGRNPEVKPFEGQKLEVAAALARIAMPGIRSERAINTFLKTLPNEFSNDKEAERQIRNSINNAVSRGYAARGLPYGEIEQKEAEGFVNIILSESGYGKKRLINNQPSENRVGKYTLVE